VTTIDLRTTDLDQRLSRFTGLLDESLAAAESVPATSQGWWPKPPVRVLPQSAASSRRSAPPPKRNAGLTAEALSQLYQQEHPGIGMRCSSSRPTGSPPWCRA